jgi:hypothetical protein
VKGVAMKACQQKVMKIDAAPALGELTKSWQEMGAAIGELRRAKRELYLLLKHSESQQGWWTRWFLGG